MPNPDAVSFADLPANSFPFTLELLRADTREVVWSQTVAEPGVIQVPGLGRKLNVRLYARMRLPDGEVYEEPSE